MTFKQRKAKVYFYLSEDYPKISLNLIDQFFPRFDSKNPEAETPP
jgi:hypothetical protein